MSNSETQGEELEVLQSIYEGDENFKHVDNCTNQYKFGTEGERSTVLIEIQWPPEYPQVIPIFNLGAFYNNHLSSAAKSALQDALKEEAEKNVGDQQTYTLIEWAKENYDSVLTPHLAEEIISSRVENLDLNDQGQDEPTKVKVKKEQLSKSQKRKEWDRVDAKGERPRGYDWVDVVKHLSQSGSKQDYLEKEKATAEYLAAVNLPN